MIPIRTPEEVQTQFIEATESMLKRFKEVEDRYQDDADPSRTIGHHMFSELSYWFHHEGQVNKKF